MNLLNILTELHQRVINATIRCSQSVEQASRIAATYCEVNNNIDPLDFISNLDAEACRNLEGIDDK